MKYDTHPVYDVSHDDPYNARCYERGQNSYYERVAEGDITFNNFEDVEADVSIFYPDYGDGTSQDDENAEEFREGFKNAREAHRNRRSEILKSDEAHEAFKALTKIRELSPRSSPLFELANNALVLIEFGIEEQ